VVPDAVPDLPGEIKPRPFVFKNVNDAQALFTVAKTPGVQLVEDILSNMAERSMAKVMAQRDGLCEVLVQTQSTGDGASYLRDFQGMS